MRRRLLCHGRKAAAGGKCGDGLLLIVEHPEHWDLVPIVSDIRQITVPVGWWRRDYEQQ